MSIVLATGGFDPLHVGHLDYLEDASTYGTLWVVVNSDNWLLRKKGYCVMSWDDRARIVKALKCVAIVRKTDDSDGTVCEALREIRPKWFVNGGDRTVADPREHAVCQELGIHQLFGVGGGKTRSSSVLVPMSITA